MLVLQLHPDGLVIVRDTGAVVYMDTVANHALDSGMQFPPLPQGMIGGIYEQGVRYLVSDGNSQYILDETSWPSGDAILNTLSATQANKAVRVAPQATAQTPQPKVS